MYGDIQLNNHLILRYGLTKEFFETFRSLKYRGIEIPTVVLRPFHHYIQSFVNNNVTNRKLITTLKTKHQFTTMRDVQLKLARLPLPRVQRNLRTVKHRNTILLPGRLAPFALKSLPKANILFTISDREDQKILKRSLLPRQMRVFNYSKKVATQKIPKKAQKVLLNRMNILLRKMRNHRLFGRPSFKKWLINHIKVAIKNIKILDILIRKEPIKVISARSEIINPGTTLSLLAAKYHLPFVNIPQVLIGDASLIPTRASHYCVWGKNQQDWLIKRGIPPSKITQTGNINFESAKSFKCRNKQQFHNMLSIPENHTVITFASQPFYKQVNSTIVRWIQQTLSSLRNATVLIKPHPNDKTNFKALFRPTTKIIVLSKDHSLYDVLCHTDYLMTVSSNSAIEAAMFKKAIIVLKPKIPYHYNQSYNDYHAHLVKAKAGPVVLNKEDLSKIFKKITYAPYYKQFLMKQTALFLNQTLIPASPSASVAKVMKTLLKKRR